MTPDQLNTFQAVSGASADEVNIMIRSILGGLLILWACWMVVASLDHARNERGGTGEALQRVFRVGVVLTLGFLLIAYR